jgi:hypothetical protein
MMLDKLPAVQAVSADAEEAESIAANANTRKQMVRRIPTSHQSKSSLPH